MVQGSICILGTTFSKLVLGENHQDIRAICPHPFWPQDSSVGPGVRTSATLSRLHPFLSSSNVTSPVKPSRKLQKPPHLGHPCEQSKAEGCASAKHD